MRMAGWGTFFVPARDEGTMCQPTGVNMSSNSGSGSIPVNGGKATQRSTIESSSTFSSFGRRSVSFRSRRSRRPADGDRGGDPVRPVPAQHVRGHADQFATDPLALAIAKAAVDRSWTTNWSPRNGPSSTCRSSTARSSKTRTGRSCCYRPRRFQSAQICQVSSRADRTIGRFPHRNAMLGRRRRPAEVAAGKVTPW